MELKFNLEFRVIGEYLIQIDSQYRVNLTQILSNYSVPESKFSSTSEQWLNFLGQNDSVLSFSVYGALLWHGQGTPFRTDTAKVLTIWDLRRPSINVYRKPCVDCRSGRLGMRERKREEGLRSGAYRWPCRYFINLARNEKLQ